MQRWGKLLYAFESRIMYDGAIGGEAHLSQIDLPVGHMAERAEQAGGLAPIAVNHDVLGREATDRSLPVRQNGEAGQRDVRERLGEAGSVAERMASSETRSVVFVQDNVANYQRLTAGLGHRVDVVVLDSHGDGVRQMAEWAARHSGYRAAYIISHGTDGAIDMGAVKLSGQTLGRYSRELATIGRALMPGGDLFVYGCDVAASADGQMFLSSLSMLTGADIAASTDLTGAAAKGGDWALEWHNGQIEARSIIDGGAAFDSVLDITQIDFSAYFNADVVYDTASGSGEFADFDTGDADGRAFITQAWAEYKYPSSPNGMSNDGSYAANSYHPYVEIAATNSNTGYNAWRVSNGQTGTWTFDVSDGNYSTLHLFLSAGGVGPGSNAYFTVTLNYTDETSTTSGSMTVRDWFDDFSQSSSTYYLINGMDRMNSPSSYDNSNDPAIFGFKIDGNQSKTLTSISINITANNAGYVAFFGATAVSEASTDISSVGTTSEGASWAWVNDTTGNLTMNEDTSATVTGIAINNGEGLNLTTTISATKGTVDVVNGTGATVSGDGTGHVTISGTQDQINAAIASLIYTPAPDGEGTDYSTVTLTTTDGYTSDSIYVSVDVNNINDAPVAVADSGSATEAGGIDNATSGSNATGNVLTNDTDVDSSDTKTVSAITGGTVNGSTTGLYGTLILNADGSYSYAVDNNDSSVQALRTFSDTLTDTFTYTMRDTSGATSSTTLTITIHGQDDAPVAAANTGSATEAGGTNNGTAGSNATGNVLSNVTDVDSGDGKTVSAISGGTVGGDTAGSYGTLVLNSDGSYTYSVNEANADVQALASLSDTLTDTFSYTVSDTFGATSSTTLTITVHGQNDAPVAPANTGSATEAGGTSNGTAGSNATGNVLSNVTDVDTGDTKAVSAISGGTLGGDTVGSYGTLVLNSDGSYTYTVDESNSLVQALRTFADTLTDTFTYTVTDASGATASTTLTVTVHGQNDAPVATPTTGSATESGGTNNTAAGTDATGNVLSSVTDVDTGDTKTVSAISGGTLGGDTVGSYGTLVLNSDGSYTYTVDESNSSVQALRTFTDTLTDTFTYTVIDASGATSSTTLTVTVHGQNDALVADPATLIVDWNGGGVQIADLTGNFVDLDLGETFTYVLTAGAPNWLSVSSNGEITGTIPTGSSGTADFTVIVTDSAGHSATIPVNFSYSNPAANTIDTGTTPPPSNDPYSPTVSQGYEVPRTIVTSESGPSSEAGYGMASESGSGYGMASDSGSQESSGPGNGNPNAEADTTNRSGGPSRSSGFDVNFAPHFAGRPDELIINEHIQDHAVQFGQSVAVQIPKDAFVHTNSDARVVLSIALENGSPLPQWLTFNSRTGVIMGTPPYGFTGDIVVKVIARDEQGREVSQTFRLTIGDSKGKLLPNQTLEKRGELQRENIREAGHPGLSEQIKQFDGPTGLTDAQELMKALYAVRKV